MVALAVTTLGSSLVDHDSASVRARREIHGGGMVDVSDGSSPRGRKRAAKGGGLFNIAECTRIVWIYGDGGDVRWQ
jgi:hypothetical protein